METESHSRRTAHLWGEIQDIIGQASLWPPRIQRLFWTPGLNYFQRFLVVTFCFINGLEPGLALRWMDSRNAFRRPKSRRHAVRLFEKMEEGRYSDKTQYNYFGYNVSTMRWEYLDGSPKLVGDTVIQ